MSDVDGFVHRFEPAGRAGAPALLLLHGTGGDENDLVGLGRAVAPGAALLSPRGRVTENGMPRFFRRLAEGVFDLAEVEARALELADFVEAAAERYGIDRRRLIALGFSNGANIAASMMLLRPSLLGGAALLRPMVILEPEAPAGLDGVPVLIQAGAADPMVLPGQPARLAAMLRAAGAEVTLEVSPGGHGLTQADVDGLAAWLSARAGHG